MSYIVGVIHHYRNVYIILFVTSLMSGMRDVHRASRRWDFGLGSYSPRDYDIDDGPYLDGSNSDCVGVVYFNPDTQKVEVISPEEARLRGFDDSKSLESKSDNAE